jgi:sulfate/thiosulfate transport system substrate-binding protein
MFKVYPILIVLLALSSPLLSQQTELENIRKKLENKRGTDSKESSLELLNVSYDPTREFYEAYNTIFTAWWKERTEQDLTVVQSHGGSGKQARAIITGLKADVATLAIALDIDTIQKLTGLVGENWQQRLPNNSCPYFSTVVFLVRKGNPKNIRNWDDLAREGVKVITPNPKTSGAARWIYLAAWAWAQKTFNNDSDKIKEYMVKLYANVPVLDNGARASTTTFVQRNMGDVLINWENEAHLIVNKLGRNEYEIVYPSLSILAEPPVTWLNGNIKENGTQDAAEFYLEYLYSVEAQELAAQYYYRPYDSAVAKANENRFPRLELVSIKDLGGWEKAQEMHFKDNSLFDEIFLAGRKQE